MNDGWIIKKWYVIPYCLHAWEHKGWSFFTFALALKGKKKYSPPGKNREKTHRTACNFNSTAAAGVAPYFINEAPRSRAALFLSPESCEREERLPLGIMVPLSAWLPKKIALCCLMEGVCARIVFIISFIVKMLWRCNIWN